MVGVAENDFRAQRFQRFLRNGFDGARCSHRHKHGGLHGLVGQMELRAAAAGRGFFQDFKLQAHQRILSVLRTQGAPAGRDNGIRTTGFQYAVPMDALIVGESTQLLLPIPCMLYRAGFSVDLITTSWLLRWSRFARAVCKPKSFDEMVQLAFDCICGRGKPYDWVIPGDDMTLRALGALDWPEWARATIFAGEE